MLSEKESICTMTNLKSCYDRQLTNIRGIIKESAGRDRTAVKLIVKVISNWRYYILIGFGISDSYYGGKNNKLAGTGQGNRFSGDVCRDLSCLIIKDIEKKDLGMIVVLKVSNVVVH